MPIYEYVCSNCGRREEVLHGVHASGPDSCSVCAGSMRKALSTPAIVFKGSGWAKKDARAARSSSSRDGKDDKSSAGDTKPSSEGGSGSAGEAAAASD